MPEETVKKKKSVGILEGLMMLNRDSYEKQNNQPRTHTDEEIKEAEESLLGRVLNFRNKIAQPKVRQ